MEQMIKEEKSSLKKNEEKLKPDGCELEKEVNNSLKNAQKIAE